MKKILPIITIFVLLTPTYLGLAQEVNPPIQNPEEYTQPGVISETPEATITKIFSMIFRVLLIIASVYAVVMFIWAGLLYIMGKGKTEKGDVAKDRLIWGVVGLVIALVSYGVVTLLSTFILKGTTK
jgi:hypothetical protein